MTPLEIITGRELARRVGNGERQRVVKIGDDRWKVLSDSDTQAKPGDAEQGSASGE